jgi:hypothetical protein
MVVRSNGYQCTRALPSRPFATRRDHCKKAMKVYNLQCTQTHQFEGWFASELEFETQNAKGMIECPVCSDRHVTRLPSAPHLNLSRPAAEPPGAVTRPGSSRISRLEQEWVRLARVLIENTEDVGKSFADEARRIHNQEAPDRGIRGVTTADERAALSEEGIEVLQLPLPALAKETLH